MISVLQVLGNDPGRRERPIRTGRRDKPIIHLPSIALRVAVVIGIAAVLLGVVLFRLWFLQILSGEEFEAQANNNRLRSMKVAAPRGAIVDRHGEVIVENRPGLAVGVRLMDVPEGELDAQVVRLGRVLRTRPAAIRTRIKDHLRPSWPLEIPLTWENIVAGRGVSLDLIVVKEDVGKRVVSYLLERTDSFPGVEIHKNYLRSYPQGRLAAHVLGNLGEVSREQLKDQHFKGYKAGDVVGQAGLEWTYDKWLRGRDGIAKIEVDAFGQPKQSDPVSGGRLPEPGHTLVTTIDGKVQAAAERALREGISLAYRDGKYEANGGAAVVLDARNGQILGMASYPSFSPSEWVGGISVKDYKKYRDPRRNTPLFNRAVQSAKAVGSTFKVVDAIAGLEEGVVTPYESFFCDGSYKPPIAWDEAVWGCWAKDGHGSLSLVGALTQSCDVYFYNLGYRFYLRQGTELADWAVRLGMGKETGVDIPGEVAGRVPTPAWRQSYFESEVDKVWTPGNSINLAIGQGDLEATPLQLAVTYAAIANGGRIVTPHLGLKITDAAGKTVRDLAPRSKKKIDISGSTLGLVQRGLHEAANSSSGTSAAVFAGYDVTVAGKTGTAEVWDDGRYVDYAWYASYAPAGDPKYVVVVMIEKGGHGGTVAAPATRMIYDSLFHVKSDKVIGPVRSD